MAHLSIFTFCALHCKRSRKSPCSNCRQLKYWISCWTLSHHRLPRVSILYHDTSLRPQDSIILVIQSEPFFRNSLRLISALQWGCHILKFQPQELPHPSILTVGADDLLFSVMKELTFSYLESPAGLCRRVSKSKSGPKVSRLIRNWKGFFFLVVFVLLSETLASLLSNGAVAKAGTDLLYAADEKAPC